ncbi:MAG: DUF4253 domain-containing protein [Oscillospiraceae bacterium]|nr:DUF4253 domain-containing protein [Oscillospiraceae bacterium]
MFGFGKRELFKKNEPVQRVIDMLGCPYQYFREGTNIDVIMSAYNEAFARREMDGCTPLIIVDNMYFQTDDSYPEFVENLKSRREQLLSSPQIDTRKWFVDKLTEEKNGFGEYWKKVVGEVVGEPEDAARGFHGFVNFGTKKSVECVLAKIPVTNPWEVFAWLPFGGWNECPPPEEIIWIAKYWYEKYGAVPAVMTCDILEFAARPVKDKTAALDLALEQFAFCEDNVFQGVDTIGRLAGRLMQSSVWYFWWD